MSIKPPARAAFLVLMGILAMSASTSCSRNELSGKMDITFEVESTNVPPADTVFITGNHVLLGDWEPGAVPMEKVGDHLWRITLPIPYGARLEYKFSLGSWPREALNASGLPAEQHKLAAVHSQTVRHQVDRWKADGIPSIGVTGAVKYHFNRSGPGLVPRHVIVWLPPGYETGDDHYPVLYLHDGQNVFDPKTSFLGTDWGVDEAMTRLLAAGEIAPAIVVGIYNSPDRADEYGLGPTGEAYRQFVVNIVKPLIDSTYRTKPGRDDTSTMGSSMGGLVSFLLAWRHPDVFKQAACLSPAFFPEAVDLVRQAPAMPAGLRLYMDNGTLGLDVKLQVMCDDMLSALADKGYAPGAPDFEWFLDEGADHNEPAWAKRVDRPLRFLLAPAAP